MLVELPSTQLGFSCPEGPCYFGALLLAPHCMWGCGDAEPVTPGTCTGEASSPFPSRQLDPSLLASKNQQAAKERECEELYELLEQLMQVHEALLQDHACLGALHDQLSGQYQALVEEHSRHKTLLRSSLEMESKAFRRRWVPATVGATSELSRLPSPFALAPRGSPGSAASQEEK